jgi:cell division protein FtsW
MGGANASRWVRIPIINMSFQTSAFASLALLVWLARWFAVPRELNTLKDLLPALIAIAATCGLVLPADFSTTFVIFFMSMIVAIVGGTPWHLIGKTVGIAVAALAVFILVVLAFPGLSNRVSTWKARIVNFAGNEEDTDAQYQTTMAKMAIAEGQFFGKGPGKSVQKNFLPQSNSDFVYAIITEEYGLVGATTLMLIYIGLYRRFIRIAKRAHTKFGTLLVIAAASGMILQTLINMAVATNLIPVTGQTLPLVSAGGSSIWMTCIALGIILSVSHTDVKKIIGNSEQELEEAGIDESTNDWANE